MDKVFRINWLNGTSEIIHGDSISDAFMKAGYSAGAIRSIDYWSELTEEETCNVYKS